MGRPGIAGTELGYCASLATWSTQGPVWEDPPFTVSEASLRSLAWGRARPWPGGGASQRRWGWSAVSILGGKPQPFTGAEEEVEYSVVTSLPSLPPCYRVPCLLTWCAFSSELWGPVSLWRSTERREVSTGPCRVRPRPPVWN